MMVELRRCLDSVEALELAIEGYDHLPANVLTKYLLDHYTVDLDAMADFHKRMIDGHQRTADVHRQMADGQQTQVQAA